MADAARRLAESGMSAVFGYWIGDPSIPGHAGSRHASAGQPVLGPHGLIDHLEAAFGLGAPEISAAERIAAWQAKLQSLHGNRFWTRSFEADPWSAAAAVLELRDELVSVGWDGRTPLAAPRLADIAAAEATGNAMPDGLADRASRVIAALGAVPFPLRFSRIGLLDNRKDLPPIWQRLLDALEQAGTQIEAVPRSTAASPDTALGRFQRWLIEGGNVAWKTDTSVVDMVADTELAAAEMLATWCATERQAPSDPMVVVAQGGTNLLDHAFALRGLNQGGLSLPSPFRGAFQILPLAFQTCWSPMDAAALLELVTAPGGPVPPRVGRRLSRVLREMPGTGGQAWVEAWAAIEASEAAVAPDKAEERIRRWRAWVEPARHDVAEGLPLSEAVAVCDRVSAWAIAAAATRDDDSLFGAQRLATRVRTALLRLGMDPLPRHLVSRVIDAASGQGLSDSRKVAQAGPWRFVGHPGSVWGSVDTLVWWQFSDTGERPRRGPWWAAERAAMSDAGLRLETPGSGARLLAASWEQPVLAAAKRIVFVRSTLRVGELAPRHPFAHRIAPALERAERAALDAACVTPTFSAGGTTVVRLPIGPRPLPVQVPVWRPPAEFAARIAAASHSATSLETLLQCQFQWALSRLAGLRRGNVQSLPDNHRLLGNLAHAMARRIFLPGAPPTPEEATAAAADMIDDLVDDMAVPLRAPAAATDLAAAREDLPAAMAALAEVLTVNGLEVVATEEDISGTVGGLDVAARIDLLARTADGRPVTVDTKWSRQAKYRADELRAGRAVQIAAYNALLGIHPEGGPGGEGGYFMARQREFLVPAGGKLSGRTVSDAPDLATTWSNVSADVKAHVAGMPGGMVARGIEGHLEHLPKDLLMELDVRCNRCDFTVLCRVSK